MIDQGLAFEKALLIVLGILLILGLSNGWFIISRVLKPRFSKKAGKKGEPALNNKDKLSPSPEQVEYQGRFSKISTGISRVFRVLGTPFRIVLGFVQKLRPIHWNFIIILLNVMLLPLAVYLLIDISGSPGIIWHYPSVQGSLDNFTRPVIVEFDRPINTEIIQPYIFPEVGGEWVAEPVYDWLPFIKRRLKFYPKESMFPGKVFIYYAGITDLFDRTEKWEYGIDAFSVPMPVVNSMSPENEAKDVAVDGTLDVELSSETGPFVEWELDVNPNVGHTISVADAKQLRIDFSEHLTQSTVYKYKLFRKPVRYSIATSEVIERGDRELVKEGKFTTVKEPLFGKVEPSGTGVLVDRNIKVIFDQPMEKETATSGFSITPQVAGTFSWENDKTLIYDPTGSLAKETKYTINFVKGLRSLAGGFTEKKFSHSFTTIGAVQVSSFYPGGGAGNIAIGSNISVTFNQEVDKSDAQSKFSISPSVPGSISWSGNTLVFNPSQNLAYDKTYTINIGQGVKTIYGLDARSSFNATFRTSPQVFSLNVPVYYQTLRYACNLVATRMALAYRGTYISTGTAHAQVAKDSTPWNANKNTWGNPHSGFVGDITGVKKGYGVYWGPVSGLISNYRPNAIRVGWSRTDMLKEVKKGNPVIIWAHNGYSYAGQNISWKTPGGTNIYAISGMHSYVVVGWIGNINNPSSIILNDPNRGRWTVSTGYFNALWSYFGRASVVVY